MNAVIVSDLHLGLPYFRAAAFADFVHSLDPGVALILNGDIIDRPGQSLPPQHQAILDLLVAQSCHRRLVWIYGNHDHGYDLDEPGNIEFRSGFSLGNRLMVVHGDGFDNIMPRNRWFLRMCKMIHQIRLRMGAEPTHVAEVARRWVPVLYHVMTERVKRAAVEFAVAHNYCAITCGHTHYAEDTVRNGIRYINTGTWTEQRLHYISVSPSGMSLNRFVPAVVVARGVEIATPCPDDLGRAAM